MKHKYETTGSTLVRKEKKKLAIDDYGIKLPTPDGKHESDEEDQHDLKEKNEKRRILSLIEMMKNA